MNPSSDPPGSSRHGKRPMIPSSSSSSSESSSSSSSSERSRHAAAAAVVAAVAAVAAAAAAAAAEEKKPQPVNAECYVCGRRFGAWKALFGHMRCHPEREWRGVRPLAEGEGSSRGRRKWRRTTGEDAAAAAAQEPADGQYKCGECLRVFETRQALGGHRASHRGVMGCSAKARETTTAASAVAGVRGGDSGTFVCQVCQRQFVTYHGMRVHQKVHRERREAAAEGGREERGREERGFVVDLNLPPPPEAEEEEEEQADKDAGE